MHFLLLSVNVVKRVEYYSPSVDYWIGKKIPQNVTFLLMSFFPKNGLLPMFFISSNDFYCKVGVLIEHLNTVQ